MSFFGDLDPEAYDRQYGDAQLVRRMAQFFAPHRRRVLIIVVALTVTALLDVVFPLVISRGVNALAEHAPAGFIGLLVGAVFLSGVLAWGMNYIRRRIITRTVGDVI